VDLHLAYRRPLGATALEIAFELFNVLNQQRAIVVESRYVDPASGVAADPIIGGTADDLLYLKGYGGFTIDSVEASSPVPVNPNFRRVLRRQAPLHARIGVTLSF
jgi:hypothetical protein